MSSILVVERESQDQERIQAALRAEGWKVRIVAGADQAMQAAAAESPDLVVVSADVPGVEALASSFSRNAGGPGVLGILPPLTAGAGVGAIEADDLLAKPFTDQELRDTVRRALETRRQAPAAAAASLFEAPNQKLTSHDIFGDVLAEMEEEMPQTTFAPPPRPPARPVAMPGAAWPAPAPEAPRPAAPAPPPGAPPAAARASTPASRSDDELQRKLEQTLSGVLGTAAPELKPRPPAPPAAVSPAPAPPAAPTAAPRRPPTPSESAVDALLSKTLGNIDLGPRSRPAPPAAMPPAATPPAAMPAAAPPRTIADDFGNVGATQPMQIPASLWSAETAPPESVTATPAPVPPAARKSGRTGEIDFAELEELARPGRRPEPERPAAPPAAAPVPPPAHVPFPGSPGAISLPISQAEEAEMLFDLAPELPEPPPLPAEEPEPEPEPAPEVEAPPRNISFDGSATQWIPIVPKEEGGEAGLRFGQYTLLDRIAVGGMAELWKARMRGVEGFQKTVAIKKILPHMTDNSDFIEMFVDEAKLAAQLSHPNIVHIYDLGRINRDYYIAMEYVDGKDLRSLLNAARRRNLPLPPGLALLIAARLAGALDYAHRMRDFEGNEMSLVHRDVSPQNVLLTYEGDVKLCDFGIAKAVS
ncbi:MAG TPA: protein kinase, partial [Thermoanaerobaculia bacterium]|nr:protein kinase [Thermoanaerobaculia bacterium]